MTDKQKAELRDSFDKIIKAKKELNSAVAYELEVYDDGYIIIKKGIEDIAEAYGTEIVDTVICDKKWDSRTYIDGVKVIQYRVRTVEKTVHDYVS